MGAFDWLRKALDQLQEDSCDISSTSKEFVEEHSTRMEAAKRKLKEQQAQKRQKRLSSTND